MIIILNGSLGIGKTETSWALLERFERGVMLDGDYIGAVQPFEIYDPDRIEYLYQTLQHLVAFHIEHGYFDFVINYVFEEPESLARLKELLDGSAGKIYTYRLVCQEEEAARRIQKRSQDSSRVRWELDRFCELVRIQEAADWQGDLGETIDITHSNPGEAADEILRRVRSRPNIRKGG